MTIESKPENLQDLPDNKTMEASANESVESRKPLILPPPVPGQTAWSIMPW